MNPKVSIILPIYNVERYLDRCMASILGQTLREIEVILVDDGALGRCPAMCDEYVARDPRVKVIHQENRGAGLARNAGLKVATGKYMAFIDSDDYVELTMIEKMYTLAEERQLDAVSCGVKNLKPDGTIKFLQYAYPEYHETSTSEECWQIAADTIAKPRTINAEGVTVMHRLSVWRFLFRSEVIRRHNICFPSERETFSEDLIFNLRFVTASTRIGYLPDFLVYHCYNDESLTATRKKLREYKLYGNHYRLLMQICAGSQLSSEAKRMTTLSYVNLMIKHVGLIVSAKMPLAAKLALIREVCDDHEVWHAIWQSPLKAKLNAKQKLLLFLAYHRRSTALYYLYRLTR